MRSWVVRIVAVLGISLLAAACDKCGNLDITGIPKSCADAKPQ